MQVTVPRPDVKGRTEILNWYLSKIKVDTGKSAEYCCFFFPGLFYSKVWHLRFVSSSSIRCRAHFLSSKDETHPQRLPFAFHVRERRSCLWSPCKGSVFVLPQPLTRRSSPGARWASPGPSWRTWSTRRLWRQLWTRKRWSQWRIWSSLKTRSSWVNKHSRWIGSVTLITYHN